MTRAELRAAFAHAVSAGRLPDDHSNPCDRVRGPPYRRRTRALSERELTDLLNWLPTTKLSASPAPSLKPPVIKPSLAEAKY